MQPFTVSYPTYFRLTTAYTMEEFVSSFPPKERHDSFKNYRLNNFSFNESTVFDTNPYLLSVNNELPTIGVYNPLPTIERVTRGVANVIATCSHYTDASPFHLASSPFSMPAPITLVIPIPDSVNSGTHSSGALQGVASLLPRTYSQYLIVFITSPVEKDGDQEKEWRNRFMNEIIPAIDRVPYAHVLPSPSEEELKESARKRIADGIAASAAELSTPSENRKKHGGREGDSNFYTTLFTETIYSVPNWSGYDESFIIGNVGVAHTVLDTCVEVAANPSIRFVRNSNTSHRKGQSRSELIDSFKEFKHRHVEQLPIGIIASYPYADEYSDVSPSTSIRFLADQNLKNMAWLETVLLTMIGSSSFASLVNQEQLNQDAARPPHMQRYLVGEDGKVVERIVNGIQFILEE